MKLLVENKIDLDRAIDPKYNPETSIVLRYKNAFQFGGTPEEDLEYKEWLQKVSIREGARIFPLLTYEGVEIFISDETSLMHTKTLKSIDGCITIARCKLNGYERVVYESGGNTGTALTRYGVRAGLETFMFIPEENLSVLNSTIFESEKAHLVSVEKPGLVKEAAHLLGELNGLKYVPDKDWRYEASMFRGFFILEYMLEKEKFDWLTQTISAAFGPIGIYRVLKGFGKEIGQLPRFLGIQQEANSPLFTAWKKGETDTEPAKMNSTNKLLTKVMYDRHPQTYGTFEEFRNILSATGGDLTTVNQQEFTDFLKDEFDGKTILNFLKDHGIEITLNNGEVVEKTGLIALAGALKEIDNGMIAKGSKVLCCLTSGISEADGKAKPEITISSLGEISKGLFRKPGWLND
jgi:threonine synthase